MDAYQEDWVAGRSGVFGLTLACDDAGSLYVMGTSVDEETGEESTAAVEGGPANRLERDCIWTLPHGGRRASR